MGEKAWDVELAERLNAGRDETRRLAEAQRTIAAQTEELARVTAERDEAESKARYWQDRGENMRVGRERLETCIAGLREELGMQQQAAADAEAQLARMTERHGRLRVKLADVLEWYHSVQRGDCSIEAGMASVRWVAESALADDDAAAKEGV